MPILSHTARLDPDDPMKFEYSRSTYRKSIMAFAFNPDTQPQDKFRFVVGLRFELFYALQNLTYNHSAACEESRASMHIGWKEKTLEKLPDSFHTNFKTLGGSPHFWPAMADALEHCP